jgi:hypothetical protein
MSDAGEDVEAEVAAAPEPVETVQTQQRISSSTAVPFGILEATASISSYLPGISDGLKNKSEIPVQSAEDRNPHYLPSVFLRMPNTAWGICFGLLGQSIMWKAVEATPFFSDIIDNCAIANAILWWAGLFSATVVGAAYTYKLIWHHPLVTAEWNCPTRVHFMNGPHLTLMFLTIGVPNSIGVSTRTLQCVFAVALVAQTLLTQIIYEVSTV